MATKVAELKKQVEYYLSDKNLTTDKFFNEKIKESAEGWIDLTSILACNKIKRSQLLSLTQIKLKLVPTESKSDERKAKQSLS